jgi:predicted DsbA family dithiol-disulfide isomerase/uncharacterized membrane protein
MVNRTWFAWTLVLAIAALSASAALLADHLHPAPVFCGADGGCAALQATVYARPWGLPLPGLGIAGFLAVALTALLAGKTARRVHAGLALSGGAIALGLLAIQISKKTVCPYCVVVDVSAIGLAGLSLARGAKSWEPPAERRAFVLALFGVIGAVAFPLVLGPIVMPWFGAVPRSIAEEMARTPKGKTTLVDFVDFECPHCRLMHAELAPLVEAHRNEVRLVRKHVPLNMHPHAVDAAKACLCAEAQGLGEPMADALVRALPRELSAEGCEDLAVRVGVSREAYRACVNSRETVERLASDRAAFVTAGGHGLPLLWINGTKIEGSQDQKSLEKALEAAKRAQSPGP